MLKVRHWPRAITFCLQEVSIPLRKSKEMAMRRWILSYTACLNTTYLAPVVIWKWSVLHRLTCLNIWSRADDAIWGHYGPFRRWSIDLKKKSGPLGTSLETISRLQPQFLYALCFLSTDTTWPDSLLFHVLCLIPCLLHHDRLYLSGNVSHN